jgi:hypothetical protein
MLAGPVFHQHRNDAGLANHPGALATGLLATLPVVFKLLLVAGLASGWALRCLLRTGLYLAQAGEFGFDCLWRKAMDWCLPT